MRVRKKGGKRISELRAEKSSRRRVRLFGCSAIEEERAVMSGVRGQGSPRGRACRYISSIASFSMSVLKTTSNRCVDRQVLMLVDRHETREPATAPMFALCVVLSGFPPFSEQKSKKGSRLRSRASFPNSQDSEPI